jgi:hypothetical protein
VVQEAHAGDVLFDDYMTDKISNLAIALAWWVGRAAGLVCCFCGVAAKWRGASGRLLWLVWTEADPVLHQTEAMRTACT